MKHSKGALLGRPQRRCVSFRLIEDAADYVLCGLSCLFCHYRYMPFIDAVGCSNPAPTVHSFMSGH